MCVNSIKDLGKTYGGKKKKRKLPKYVKCAELAVS